MHKPWSLFRKESAIFNSQFEKHYLFSLVALATKLRWSKLRWSTWLQKLMDIFFSQAQALFCVWLYGCLLLPLKLLT